MGLPTEQAAHRLQTIGTPAAPALRILQAAFEALAKSAGKGHVHQQAIATALQDLAGAAIVGGHHRKA